MFFNLVFSIDKVLMNFKVKFSHYFLLLLSWISGFWYFENTLHWPVLNSYAFYHILFFAYSRGARFQDGA